MSKNKLRKFSELDAFSHVFQLQYNDVQNGAECEMKGRWAEFFGNGYPIVVELGCGRGEYTVALARCSPERNYIGVDVKGARLWTGAKQAKEENLHNVTFIRTNIEMLSHCFAEGEISEIWLTFPDPQMKKCAKRLTSTNFLKLYGALLKKEGLIHLKTDSHFMFTYTRAVAEENRLPIIACNEDIYNNLPPDDTLSIRTYYEQQWLARGITIKYLCFRLLQQQEWKEPAIEIELDSYRSYGRSKRSGLKMNL